MKKLHLAVEAVGAKYGGAATVLFHLVQAALADERFGRVSVFCSPKQARLFDLPTSAKLREIELATAEQSVLYRLWWLQRGMRADLERIGADVVISLSGMGRGTKGTPHVPFIQQSLPFTPEVTATAGLIGRLRMATIFHAMKRACRTSAAVVVQTEVMKTVVTAAFGLRPERVHVDPPPMATLDATGTPSEQLARMRLSSPGFRILYVGSQSPYKKVDTLLAAGRLLKREWPAVKLFLTWPEDDPMQSDDVVCLGYLKGSALGEAYQLADYLVMPSLVETVALPLLEAMSAGTPVLAADRPYAHEVCGEAAAFFDPLSPEDLACRISSMISNREIREELIEAGKTIAEARRSKRAYEKMLDVVAQAGRP